MKELVYTAIFAPQPEGGYTVTFPDVPGAISEGDSFDEAWFNAREALELVLEAHAEAGEPFPPKRGIEVIAALLTLPRGAKTQLITAAAPTKAVRINVTIDEGLLERLNRRVDESGQSRSAFIAEAVRKQLRQEV